MSLLIAFIVSALIGLGAPAGQNVQNTASPNSPPPVCLDAEIAKNGIDPGTNGPPKLLKNIPKPNRENVTRGYEIPLCQNVGNCPGPDTSDYILVSTNVQADHVVFPNNFEEDLPISDRQLVKQTDSGEYSNHIYRTYCGDWCSTCNPDDVVCADGECLKGECKTDKPPVTLPFRGTYHCDFIFYLQDKDDKGRVQIDKDGNIVPAKQNEILPELPANGSLFSVYMRAGAAIPDTLKCPVPSKGVVPTLNLKQASQKSLKLTTFLPTPNWIRKWAQESKPAIYLYPRKETKVTVKLHPAGYLTVSDPPYDAVKGWEIIAYPDGTIRLPKADDQRPTTFPYLYYEAAVNKIPVVASGFVVKKEKLTSFLTGNLNILGLNDKEIRDYLEYWLPRLNGEKEDYFLVYFLSDQEIEMLEPIDINMQINTSIRIRTYFKPLKKPINITRQILEKSPERTGNTLVEWGGILDTP